jgi:hypothetical protein
MLLKLSWYKVITTYAIHFVTSNTIDLQTFQIAQTGLRDIFLIDIT